MTGDVFTPTLTPSAQVVLEALVRYAQHDYEAKRIGWSSYADYTVKLYSALCSTKEVSV